MCVGLHQYRMKQFEISTVNIGQHPVGLASSAIHLAELYYFTILKNLGKLGHDGVFRSSPYITVRSL